MATISVMVEGIPEELKTCDQWVVWRTEEREGKPTKVPYRADGLGKASSTDRTTWASFDVAFQAYLAGGWDGIGFVFTAEDPYAGVDLDNCRDPESGEIAPWAKAIIRRLDSYTEISPSGTGVKIFLKGRLPRDEGGKCRHRMGMG